MDNNGQIRKLSKLTDKLRDKNISYQEFKELKNILIELHVFSEIEFEKMLANFGYDSIDTLFNKISTYTELSIIDKSNTSSFIGAVSGGTMSQQLKFILENKKSS